jgi:hypothetical protein
MRMRPASWLVVFLVTAAAAFTIYSMVITPRLDSGVPEQGYRPPIQDNPSAPTPKSKPFEKSNVPPAG